MCVEQHSQFSELRRFFLKHIHLIYIMQLSLVVQSTSHQPFAIHSRGHCGRLRQHLRLLLRSSEQVAFRERRAGSASNNRVVRAQDAVCHGHNIHKACRYEFSHQQGHELVPSSMNPLFHLCLCSTVVVWILTLAPLAPASALEDRTLDTRFGSATSDRCRLHSNLTSAVSSWARDATQRLALGTFRRRS